MLRHAPKCPLCYGRGPWCLCPRVRPVDTRTHFIFLQHATEACKPSNTLRVAVLALKRCEVRPYGDKATALATDDLSLPGTWLLFPGGDGPSAPASPWPPERLVVLDGSWSQARRMLHRLPVLRALPRLGLEPAKERRSLRAAPEGGMSTLEAVARAVAHFEGPERAEPLDELHALMIERVVASRGYL